MRRTQDVLAWVQRLREDAASAPAAPLSSAGLHLVLDHALDAITEDALGAALAEGDAPYTRVAYVAARTVLTAPIEWCALLLAHGSALHLKHPEGAPGLTPWLVAHAASLDLPLSASSDRSELARADLLIAMGHDDTLAALRERHAHVLGFGHRVSLALAPRGTGPDELDALAADLAAHDGRGCMSPCLVLTDDPTLHGRLADAMATAATRWPRGQLTPGEHASLRSRRALARAGGVVSEGEGWSVHQLPTALTRAVSLPRSAQLAVVDDISEAMHALARRFPPISTIGQPERLGVVGAASLAPRCCVLGRMQAPPLHREHDGVPHLRAITRRAPA